MTYQAGDRIVLVQTSDPHTRLVPGTAGTVTGYDTRSASSPWPGMTAAPWPCCCTTATRSASSPRAPASPTQPARIPRPVRAPGHHRPRDRRQQAPVRAVRHLHPAQRRPDAPGPAYAQGDHRPGAGPALFVVCHDTLDVR